MHRRETDHSDPLGHTERVSSPPDDSLATSPFVVESSLRRLLRSLPGMAYRCRVDPERTMEFVSEGCRGLTGFSPADLVDNRVASFQRLIHGDDRARVQSEVTRAVASNRPFRVTYRIRRADGMDRHVWEQGVGVRDPLGSLVAIEGFVTDVTDRSELNALLEDQTSLHSALTEQALVGVFLLVGDRLRYANPRFAQLLFGRSEDMLRGASILEHIAAADRERVALELQRLEDGDIEVARVTFRSARDELTRAEIETHISRIQLDGRLGLAGLATDVTERRRAERRYHEAQKLESLGRLAASVAHDFNNILTVINNAAHFLQEEIDPESDAVKDLADLTSAVDRGAALSRQLMDFGRVREPVVQALSAPDLIMRMAPVLNRLAGREIDLQLAIDSSVSSIRMGESELEQIALNLVVNACDAMAGGGIVVLSVREELAAPLGSEGAATKPGPYVVIEVRDRGVGIEPELMDRLFDPYFTTKGEGGTGLGLATVWRIAVDLGGCVHVESEVGEGTAFSVYLPVAADDPSAPPRVG
jgi:PAS domain S-box-containing protein